MNDVLQYLDGEDYFPVMGTELSGDEIASVRFDESDTGSRELSTFAGLKQFIDRLRAEKNAAVLYGGYAEHRSFYQKAEQYIEGGTPREYHLGVDVWCDPGDPVFAPWDGTIVSSLFRSQIFDYGGMIILRHVWPSKMIYTLYGHLSRPSVDRYAAGDEILAGDILARIGEREENGGWVPHLHLQCMKDLLDYEDDFPGVVARPDLDRMLELCPNPEPVLFHLEM